MIHSMKQARDTRALWCAVVGVASLWLAGCAEERTGPAAAIDAEPSTATQPLNPGIVCVDQKETAVQISGQNFSPVSIDVPKNPRTAIPTVKLTKSSQLDGAAATEAFEFTYNGDPDFKENLSLLSWQSQQQMTFQVRPRCAADTDCPDGLTCQTDKQVCAKSADELLTGPLQEGVYSVTVTNPNTSSAQSVGAFAVIQQPTLADLSPGILCLSQGERTLSLTGTRFLSVNDAQVQVEIATAAAPFVMDADGFEGCAQIPQKGYTKLEYCTGASTTLAQDSVQVGAQTVTIKNPETAACQSEEQIMLRVVPPPHITAIRETAEDAASTVDGNGTIICLAEGARQIVLHGQDFLGITAGGGAELLPSVTINGTSATALSLDGTCEDLPTMNFTVRKCDQVTVEVPESLAVTDAPIQTTVVITNPDPAGCNDDTSSDRSNLLVLAPPPDLVDVEPALVCLDDGARAVVLTGTNFINIDSVKPLLSFDATAIDPAAIVPSNCEAVDVGGRTVERCTTLTVTLDQGSVPPGQPAITVENPDPAGCSDTANGLLTIPPALAITSVNPENICINDVGVIPLTISGTGFLTVDGTAFALTINGQAVTPDSVTDCTDLNVNGQAVQSCNTIAATFDTTGLPVGDIPVAITNPSPSDCALDATSVFRITAPPTITSLDPTEICSDIPETFTLRGTAFSDGATVSITSTANGTITADTVTFVSDTELTVTFTTGVPADLYDVTVSNGTTCQSTLAQALTVNPTPLVFFVDPPVVFNGIPTEVTIFTTGLDQTAQSVQLISPDGTTTTDLPGFTSPIRDNRILATIPSGLPAGEYRVSVTSADDCTSVITAPLTITDTLTLAVDLVDPPFASPTVATAVTISALDPAPNGQVQFTSTPRVYLNPDSGSGNAAQAMRAVVFQDATSLSAVVPPGVTPGVYDVIVVNPGGEVGVIDQGITVTVAEPPLVTSVVPGSLVSSASTPNVTILGDHFDAAGVEITFTCLLPGGNTTTVDATAETVLDAQTVTATVPAIGTAGAVCVVRVSNSDGSYFDFSAVSTTNSSRNLNPWAATTSMTEPRRALSLEAGRPTSTSRFLYAIGGDAGSAATAKNTVETTNVSIFGDLSAWTLQRYNLPSPRTLASSAIIGRFIYVVGGHDGTAATDEVLRSEILNPLAAPEVTDLDAQLGTTDAPASPPASGTTASPPSSPPPTPTTPTANPSPAKSKASNSLTSPTASSSPSPGNKPPAPPATASTAPPPPTTASITSNYSPS